MEQQKQGNWWDRNWKWFVPVGCLGALALVAVFVGAILMIVFGAIYPAIMLWVLTRTKVKAACGEPESEPAAGSP